MDKSTSTLGELAERVTRGNVPPGEPMDIDELMAMAEITPEVIAAAQAEWKATAPAWARDLLDAEEVREVVERHTCERCGAELPTDANPYRLDGDAEMWLCEGCADPGEV